MQLKTWTPADKQTDKTVAKLVQLAAVTEAPADDGQLYQRAADAHLSATKQGKSALLVSPTWAEIEAVTDKVRDALKADGLVSQHEDAVTLFDSLSWTEAQKKNPGHFQPGQRIRFVRGTKAFAKNETAEAFARFPFDSPRDATLPEGAQTPYSRNC